VKERREKKYVFVVFLFDFGRIKSFAHIPLKKRDQNPM
jgi:hypothetical protein